MDEMLSYICSRLKASDEAFKNQVSFNRTVLMVGVIALAVAKVRADRQNEKIEQLEEEIKELKNTKGE